MKAKMFAAVAALFSITAFAEQPPIVGTIANRAGGQIVLMSNPCPRDKTQLFVYIKEEGGRISETGCWTFKKPNIYVFWDDGEVFQYDFDAMNMTPEYAEYLRRNYPQGDKA